MTTSTFGTTQPRRADSRHGRPGSRTGVRQGGRRARLLRARPSTVALGARRIDRVNAACLPTISGAKQLMPTSTSTTWHARQSARGDRSTNHGRRVGGRPSIRSATKSVGGASADRLARFLRFPGRALPIGAWGPYEVLIRAASDLLPAWAHDCLGTSAAAWRRSGLWTPRLVRRLLRSLQAVLGPRSRAVELAHERVGYDAAARGRCR